MVVFGWITIPDNEREHQTKGSYWNGLAVGNRLRRPRRNPQVSQLFAVHRGCRQSYSQNSTALGTSSTHGSVSHLSRAQMRARDGGAAASGACARFFLIRSVSLLKIGLHPFGGHASWIETIRFELFIQMVLWGAVALPLVVGGAAWESGVRLRCAVPGCSTKEHAGLVEQHRCAVRGFPRQRRRDAVSGD